MSLKKYNRNLNFKLNPSGPKVIYSEKKELDNCSPRVDPNQKFSVHFSV